MGVIQDIDILKTQVDQLKSTRYRQSKPVYIQEIPLATRQQLDILKKENAQLQTLLNKEKNNSQFLLQQLNKNNSDKLMLEIAQLRKANRLLALETDQLRKAYVSDIPKLQKEREISDRQLNQTIAGLRQDLKALLIEKLKIQRAYLDDQKKLNQMISLVVKENADLKTKERAYQVQLRSEITKNNKILDDKLRLSEQEKINYRLEIKNNKKQIQRLNERLTSLKKIINDFNREFDSLDRKRFLRKKVVELIIPWRALDI